LGVAFSLFANAMYARLWIPWASSLLGFLSSAFIPILFVLYFYGWMALVQVSIIKVNMKL
jgi:hypothetical protein